MVNSLAFVTHPLLAGVESAIVSLDDWFRRLPGACTLARLEIVTPSSLGVSTVASCTDTSMTRVESPDLSTLAERARLSRLGRNTPIVLEILCRAAI